MDKNIIESGKTLVSLTPLAVEKDSRTFKQASSFARHGYISIVVESECSNLRTEQLMFELICANEKEAIYLPPSTETIDKQYSFITKKPRLFNRILKRLFRPIKSFLYNNLNVKYLYFVITYYWANCKLVKYVPKSDLYYLHSPYYFPAVSFLSRKNKAKLIYDAHDFYSNSVDTQSFELLRIKQLDFFSWIERRYIKKVDTVVTVCDGIAKEININFKREAHVIRNAHDSRLDITPEKNIREWLSLKKSDFLIVAVGNAKPQIGIEHAIKSMIDLPDSCHMAFVGSNFDGYKKLLHSDKLKNRIHFIPPVKPFLLVPFIQFADASMVLYHPTSINDIFTLPNKLFQSIAAHLPLIYPKLPEIIKLIQEHEVGFLIDARSVASIQNGIFRLMNDRISCDNFKKNLRILSDLISWESEERLLLSIIDGILN